MQIRYADGAVRDVGDVEEILTDIRMGEGDGAVVALSPKACTAGIEQALKDHHPESLSQWLRELERLAEAW